MNKLYNVKIKYFPNGEQDITTYSNPIKTGQKREKKKEGMNQIDEWGVAGGPTIEIEDIMKKANRSMQTSLNRTKQQIYDLARANTWEYFLTITIDPEKMDRYNYDTITEKLTKWLNNIQQRKAPDLKHLLIPERHKDGAFHFHALIANIGEIEMIDSGKKNKGQIIYNMTDWRNGYTTATRIRDTLKASNYITKYITKELVWHTPGRRRYWASRNLDQPQVETDMADIEIIHDIYIPAAKRTKKKVVATNDYRNEITYITI